jgi:hypothetical protein
LEIPSFLDGKKLAPYILKERSWNRLKRRRIEFNTLDDITNGDHSYPLIVKRTKLLYNLGLASYRGVQGARNVHAQIKLTGNKIFKYAQYTDPDGSDKVDEEMYNLTDDPYEQHNLVHSKDFARIKNMVFRSHQKYRSSGRVRKDRKKLKR